MASSLAGPFVGDVDQLRNLYLQARDGDAKAGDFLRFGINHTPFLNLLGVRGNGLSYSEPHAGNGYPGLLSAMSSVYRKIRVIHLCYRHRNSC
jgi:hypothetical protein